MASGWSPVGWYFDVNSKFIMCKGMYFHRKKRYLRAEIAKKGSFSFAFPYKISNFARQK
jgi:hypothetical protein